MLHLGHGWHHILFVHRAYSYRRAADVLLPPEQSAGLPRCAVPRTRRSLRQIAAQHASLGRPLDGHSRRAAHVPRLSHRLLPKPPHAPSYHCPPTPRPPPPPPLPTP